MSFLFLLVASVVYKQCAGTSVPHPRPAAVAVAERLGRGVAAAQPGPLRQDQLQLGRRPARDQRADQRQRVLVEVRLKRNANENRSVCTYPCCLVRE